MRTLILKLLGLFVLCAAIVAWFNCTTPLPLGPDGGPYSIEPSQLTLDTAFVGGRAAEAVVVLRSYSNKDLKVQGFAGDCPSEVTWSPPSATIPSREEVSFTFRFEPQQAYGESHCSLKPEILLLENSGTPPALTVNYAAGEAACAVTPGSELDFGDVPLGTHADITLTLHNTTSDTLLANQFHYQFLNSSPDCRLFPMDMADQQGTIGPGASEEITVRFQPDALESFECRRELVSLRIPPNPAQPYITNSCPTEVVWRGTGEIGPPVWSACFPGGSTDLHAVFGLPGSEVYVAGDGGSVLASGGNCQWLASGTVFGEVDLRDIWAYSTGTEKAIWAVGNAPPPTGLYNERGTILKSDGGPWLMVDEAEFLTFASVWGSGLDDVYYAGLGIASDFPNAKHWDGSTLDTMYISDWRVSGVTGVGGTASDDVWAVLEQDAQSIVHFQGVQWVNESPGFLTEPLNDVWAEQGPDFYAVYAVGEDGAIYHFDGTNWTDESIVGETRDFYGVWVSPTGKVIVVGEGQAIYHGQVDNPTGWAAQSPPAGLPAGDLMDVWGESDDKVYAVGTNGVILRYAPGG